MKRPPVRWALAAWWALCLFSAACQPSAESARRTVEDFGTYTRDQRTGLCFLVAWSGNKLADTVTNVPCTPDVLRLIGGGR